MMSILVRWSDHFWIIEDSWVYVKGENAGNLNMTTNGEDSTHPAPLIRLLRSNKTCTTKAFQ